MMQNFIFRSAVNGAALWNLQKKLLLIYDDGRKIKTVIK